MDGFSINYALVRMRLKEVSRGINEVAGNLGKLTGYVENLDIFWDGDASEAFKNRVFSDIIKMQEVLERFTGLMKLCDEALLAYQDTEKVIQQLIGGYKYERQKKRRN